MAVRFTCIKCKKKNFSKLPVCEHCKAMQNIPIRIPQGATKEQIDKYLKKLKEAKQPRVINNIKVESFDITSEGWGIRGIVIEDTKSSEQSSKQD